MLNTEKTEQKIRMEVDKPPSKAARFSEPGLLSMGGPSTGLGLGLGPSRKSPFTFLQLQELEHQAAIYNYMAAAVPVPFHLVLPIWKSVAGSCSGLYNHYPSWLGCGSLCYDYRNSMEPEPGRCRRTDGKKWRCSKEVVPDQKYCERHMHRGRHRSRKPVEGSAAMAANSSDNLTTTTLASSVLAFRSGGDTFAGNFMDSNTQLSISMPGSEGLHLMTPTSLLRAGSSQCKVETSTL